MSASGEDGIVRVGVRCCCLKMRKQGTERGRGRGRAYDRR
jgi:hypothetical protein